MPGCARIVQTRQDKTRQDKTRQDKTRQDKGFALYLCLAVINDRPSRWPAFRFEEA